MPYLSAQDRRAVKSSKRVLFPLLGVFFVMLAIGGLIYLAIEKPTPPPAPTASVQPSEPTEEQLQKQELVRLQTELSAAASERNLPKLEELSRAILAVNPKDETAWGTLGRLQSQQGDHLSALESLGKGIEFSKDQTSLLAARAGVHRKLENFPAALSDLEEAARRDPSNVGVANRLLIFKIQAGQTEEVRSFVSTYEHAAIASQAPLWLLGAAALSMQDGEPTEAARYLDSLKIYVSPQQFSELLSDPFFEPYRKESSLKQFFSLAPEMPGVQANQR